MSTDTWITEIENQILPMDDSQIESLLKESKKLVKGFDIARATSQNPTNSYKAYITAAKCNSLLKERASERVLYGTLTT